MHVNNSKPSSYQENEIDFRDLMVSLFASKRLILAITLAITVLVSIYTFTITPIYQATALVLIGNYERPKIECPGNLTTKTACKLVPIRDASRLPVYSPGALVNILNSQVFENINNSISISAKGDYSIEIKSTAKSNEIAKNSLSEIIDYLHKIHRESFEKIRNQRIQKVESFDFDINKIRKFELTPINTRIFQGQAIITKKIDDINKTKLPNIEKKISLLNEIIEKTISSQVEHELSSIFRKTDYIKNIQLPDIEKKINLYSQNIAANEKLLTQSENNLQNFGSATALAALSLMEIHDLKKLIFVDKEKILDLNSSKSNLKIAVDELNESRELFQSYQSSGLLQNTPTLTPARLARIQYLENIVFEYKNSVMELEDQKNGLLDELNKLNDEKFIFTNYQVPEYELSKDRILTKIANLNYQKNDYESLLADHNYINSKVLGGIKASDSPFEPNLIRNITLAIFIGLMLSTFLVLIINVLKTPIKKKTA